MSVVQNEELNVGDSGDRNFKLRDSISTHPCIALQSLLGPGLPQTTSILPNPPSHLLHPRIPKIRGASHLVLGFPIDVIP
jgi:hypothetical protein